MRKLSSTRRRRVRPLSFAGASDGQADRVQGHEPARQGCRRRHREGARHRSRHHQQRLEGAGPPSLGDGGFCSGDEGRLRAGQARSAHQGISLSRDQRCQSVRLLHRLARHDGAAEGHDRGDARGIHGRRPGRAEGQQDHHGLSRAGRRFVRGEVTVNDLKAPIWDANLYLKFADARLRPALDLMGRLDPANGARPGHAIYDLGCGAGNISRILAERFPAAPVIGIDSSEEMLAKARSQTLDKRVTFTTGDLAHFKPGLPPSILYSNAAYQWVEGHIDMFPGLLKLLPSGGQLAIQMPRNHEAPSHALMRKAAEAGPWRDKLAKVGGIRSVFDPARYYDVLKPLCSDLDVWESIYQQVLTGKDPVAQYTAGTGLRPYMAVLDEAERTGFYDTYAKLLAEAYPMRADGITLFPFRRLFIVARRA